MTCRRRADGSGLGKSPRSCLWVPITLDISQASVPRGCGHRSMSPQLSGSAARPLEQMEWALGSRTSPREAPCFGGPGSACQDGLHPVSSSHRDTRLQAGNCGSWGQEQESRGNGALQPRGRGVCKTAVPGPWNCRHPGRAVTGTASAVGSQGSPRPQAGPPVPPSHASPT